jgi:predicted  nucleic acid-binding Zn-ribbon protein
MRDELAETDEKYQELINQSAERKHEVAELERDVADQEVKLRRAISQAKRLRRELRAGNPGPTFEEVCNLIKN